jgi:hypothetical protein
MEQQWSCSRVNRRYGHGVFSGVTNVNCDRNHSTRDAITAGICTPMSNPIDKLPMRRKWDHAIELEWDVEGAST